MNHIKVGTQTHNSCLNTIVISTNGICRKILILQDYNAWSICVFLELIVKLFILTIKKLLNK